MKTAVIYWSSTGNTEAMARAVAEGMTAAGAEAVLLTPAEVQPGDLNAYGAIAFGCPAMGSRGAGGNGVPAHVRCLQAQPRRQARGAVRLLRLG